jgi:uncharacterized YceG family protein
MAERGDWDADSEGNLTPPGDLKPPTDEFGRDDPAAIERERRRRERDQRRKGAKPKREKGAGSGASISFGRVLRRRKDRGADTGEGRTKAPRGTPPPADPPSEQPVPAPPRRGRAVTPDAPRGPSMAERATAGRDALRRRVSRGDGEGRPPRAPSEPRDPAAFRRRRFLALGAALVGVLLLWFLVAFFQPFAGDGAGEGTVSVEIPEGADAGEIAKILDEKGVVSSGQLFELRLKLAGKSDKIQAGNYTLASGMSYGTAIDRLTGADTGGVITVTIPEGLSRDQIASDVLPEGVSSDEYVQQTEAVPPGFDPAQYGAKPADLALAQSPLEGFLFPATYELQEGQGVPALIQQQLAAFKQNIARVDMSYAKKKNLTVYDILIIASMVDKEVQVPSERPLVAAVIYNRLNQGIPLGIDATTRYETKNFDQPITQAQLDANTPYNTRLNAGLPPTPIGNPGLDAIKAAAAPSRENFIYFVVKPGTCGEHSFTASEKEFERLAAEYQQALQEKGGSPTECPE